jgi:hypothetical protein
MKIRKYLLLAIIVSALCVSASICSRVTAAVLIQPRPHLANIDSISVTIDYPKNAPMLKQCYWDDLKTQFEQKLKKANLNVCPAKKATLSKTDVGLTVRIELLQVPDVNLFALRIETVMAQQMLLATGSDHVFIIPIPLWTHGIRFISKEDLPDVIKNVASQHIDQFLRDYEATKSSQLKCSNYVNPMAGLKGEANYENQNVLSSSGCC